MGLFVRRAQDLVDVRARDYLLTDCPLIAHDNRLWLVDLTVRFAARRDRPDEHFMLGYNAAEEIAVDAICVLLLRQFAEDVPSDELLTGRARMAEVVEHGLSLAPVGGDFEARVLSVDVRPPGEGIPKTRHEFRVVTT